MNILIVDKTETICNFLSDELKIPDTKITATSSLTEGYQLIQNNTFEVIIAGASSNEGSVIDFIKIIRSKFGISPKIIIMSSHPPNKISDYINNGADHFFSKRTGMAILIENIIGCIQE